MSKHYTHWPGFDALSAILFGRKLSLRWTGPTSVSENVFTRTARLLEIYALLRDNEEEVGNVVSSSTGAPIRKDLVRLADELESMAQRFTEAADAARQLANNGKV
jgi:acyl-CoA reductase-like NAD-dependent aldehyde dehydrogenase